MEALQFLGVGDEGAGPAAVFVDHFVDLLHQADCLVQGHDDLLVVCNVLLGQPPAFAVLEPLLTDLIAGRRPGSALSHITYRLSLPCCRFPPEKVPRASKSPDMLWFTGTRRFDTLDRADCQTLPGLWFTGTRRFDTLSHLARSMVDTLWFTGTRRFDTLPEPALLHPARLWFTGTRRFDTLEVLVPRAGRGLWFTGTRRFDTLTGGGLPAR